jgi:photosystem II stability/assembly factor-like uncharacterized protein
MPFALHSQTIAWEQIQKVPFNAYFNRVASPPDAPGTLVAGTRQSGLLRSTDNGDTWTAPVSGILQTSNVTSFAVYRSVLFAGTSVGVYRASNQGQTWTASGGPTSGITTPYTLTMMAARDWIFAGTDAGLYRSADGFRWERANGLSGLGVLSLAQILDTVFLAGTTQGLYRSNDNGKTWLSVSSPIGTGSVNGIIVTSSGIFAGTYGNYAFRSLDGGITWTPLATGLQSPLIISMAQLGTNIIASTFGGGVALLENPTATLWRGASFGLPETNKFWGPVSVVAGTAYVGGTYGGLFRGAAVRNPPPLISAVTPASVPASTQATVTIIGQFFTTPIVTLDGQAVTVTGSSPTAVTVSIAPSLIRTPSNKTLELTNADGQKARIPLTIALPSSPAIYFINPRLATVATVSIPFEVLGANFASNATLTINGVNTPYVINSPGTRLLAIIPFESLLTIAPVPVRVTNPNGEFGEATLIVRARPPKIDSLSPFAVTVNAPSFDLTIDGRDFSPKAQVKLGTSMLTIIRQSTTQIVAVVPANLITTITSLPVVVTNEDGQEPYDRTNLQIVDFDVPLTASSMLVCPGDPVTITSQIRAGLEPFTIISWTPAVTNSRVEGRMLTAVANPTKPTRYALVIADRSGARLQKFIDINTIQIGAEPSQAAIRYDTVNTFFRFLTTATITIRNVSADGTAITLDDPRLTVNNGNFRVLTPLKGLIIPSGQSSPPITIQYQPQNDGSHRDTIIVPYSPCNGSVSIALAGQRVTPTLPPPVPTQLTTDARGTVSASPAPTFAWRPVDFAASYSLHIARIERPFAISNGFAASDFPIVTTASAALQPSYILQPNTAYAWSIRAVNSATTSTWTAPQYFITPPTSNARLTIAPSLLDFGATVLGDNERRGTQLALSSGIQTISSVEVFAAPLRVATTSTVFSVSGSLAGSRMSSRDPFNIALSFSPTDTLQYQGVVRLRTASDTALALLTGRGILCGLDGGQGCAETELALRFAPFKDGKEKPDVGDMVTLQLVLTRSARLTDPRYTGRAQRFSADVVIQNPDVIFPTAITAPQGLSAQQVSITPTRIRFTDVSTTRGNATGDVVLAEIQAEALLADTLSTGVRFGQFTWSDASTDRPIRRILRDTSITLATCEAGGPRLIKPREGLLAIVSAKPNPVLEKASIDLTVFDTTPVTAFLVDVMGRRVKTLLSGTLSAQDYTLTLDMTDLPAGSYLLVFQTPTETLTHRLEAVR